MLSTVTMLLLLQIAPLVPPFLGMTWWRVDLLRDSRQDVRDRPWTKPASCVVIDHYFKLERAREEIQRLNVEITRVVTYIQDEDKFLHLKEADIMLVSPGLA